MDFGTTCFLIIGGAAISIAAVVWGNRKVTFEAEEKEYYHEQQRQLDAIEDEQWAIIDRMEAAETPKAFFSALDELRQSRIKVNCAVGRNSVIMVNEFLARFWMDCKEHRINAFSPEEKRHALDVFFDTIELYKRHLYAENMAQVDTYRAEYETMCGNTHEKGAE